MTRKNVKRRYENPYMEQSFRNILSLNLDEFQRIIAGEPVTEVLDKPTQRRRLHRDGVIESHYVQGGKRVSLTSAARRYLSTGLYKQLVHELREGEDDE